MYNPVYKLLIVEDDLGIAAGYSDPGIHVEF